MADNVLGATRQFMLQERNGRDGLGGGLVGGDGDNERGERESESESESKSDRAVARSGDRAIE